MNKHKKLLLFVVVLLLLTIPVLFLLKFIVTSNDNDFLSTDPKISEFATGGEISPSTRGGSAGYTRLKLDVANCPEGRDSVYFGFGHSEFLVQGLVDERCVFRYGTEIENPRWDGELDTVCKVPKLSDISLPVSDDGINISQIQQYCTESK